MKSTAWVACGVSKKRFDFCYIIFLDQCGVLAHAI
jgi:hypothetical protein